MSDPFFLGPAEQQPAPEPAPPAYGAPVAADPPVAPVAPRPDEPPAEVVLTRNARRDGKHVAVLRLLRDEHGARVDAQVFPRAGEDEVRAGPYRFSTLIEASNFVADAVDSLTYLGCEID